MKHSIFCLAILSSFVLTGCGPAFITATTMMGLSEEKKCLKLEGELREKKLSEYEVRKAMIQGDCRNYYEKFVK